MDCSDFRRHHLAYVDDTLPGDALVAAERHRIECAACSAHDTLVRRSLLLARNLPHIEPSADFAARLEARLREACPEGCGVRAPTDGAADWRAAWYERVQERVQGRFAPEAGRWGRQAMAAAAVLAAVSAGYTMRGDRVAGAPDAPPPEGTALVAPTASTAPRPTPNAGELFGSAGLGTMLGTNTRIATPVEVAARSLGTAATPVAARHTTERAISGPVASVEYESTDSLPAYIPLPAGALEASALLGPASVGVPVWPAALLAGEAPSELRRARAGSASVRLVGLSH